MTNKIFLKCLLLFLFFSLKIISQETSSGVVDIKQPCDSIKLPLNVKIKENLIIYFYSGEYSKSKKTPEDEFRLVEYFFIIPHSEGFSDSDNKALITLIDRKYEDFDAKFTDNPSLKLKIHKSFLRKNKKRILSIKKMKEMGYEKIFKLFKKAKHIFLIDKSETKGNLIIMKEVQHFYIGEE